MKVCRLTTEECAEFCLARICLDLFSFSSASLLLLRASSFTDSKGVPTASRAAPIMAVAFDAVAVVASIAMDAAVHNPISTALVIGGAALILVPKKRGRPTKASILQASAIVAEAATEAASASSGPVKKKQKIQAQLLISVVPNPAPSAPLAHRARKALATAASMVGICFPPPPEPVAPVFE